MKTEQEVYNDILNYIKGKKYNRPSTLASIKKVLRSQKIVDLIFSRPDVFRLESEFKHVPKECLTESVLVKYILSGPERIGTLDESLQTLPVMLAFEFSKRRFEFLSRRTWRQWYENIPYKGKILEHRESISAMCDELSQRISSNPNERYLLRDYLEYIERASSEILNFCGTVTKELEKEEKYTSRYFDIDFDIPERLFVFVSGKPDTGKTTFSNILSSRIRNAIHLDSDVLLERGQLCQPILGLVPDDIKVVVFSDIYAHRFFSQEELGNARVINILIEPISIEAMHRNSKFMSHIPFEDYKKYEIDKINYDSLDNSITVTNRYTGQMDAEVDTALEEIASRLGKILKSTEQSESTPTPLKRVLKPASLHEKK